MSHVHAGKARMMAKLAGIVAAGMGLIAVAVLAAAAWVKYVHDWNDGPPIGVGLVFLAVLPLISTATTYWLVRTKRATALQRILCAVVNVSIQIAFIYTMFIWTQSDAIARELLWVNGGLLSLGAAIAVLLAGFEQR